jgi:hypothetical protein
MYGRTNMDNVHGRFGEGIIYTDPAGDGGEGKEPDAESA